MNRLPDDTWSNGSSSTTLLVYHASSLLLSSPFFPSCCTCKMCVLHCEPLKSCNVSYVSFNPCLMTTAIFQSPFLIGSGFPVCPHFPYYFALLPVFIESIGDSQCNSRVGVKNTYRRDQPQSMSHLRDTNPIAT